MTSFTRTWNTAYEAQPADNENISLGAGRIRDLKADIQERLEVDHHHAGDANDGAHKKITLFTPLGADPATVANTGFLYTKDVNAQVELFWKDEAGNVVQLTEVGQLKEIPLPVGTVQNYIGTSAPTGWLLFNGDTIGSAASGADQASDDYEELFELFWNSMANSEAAVSSGRGASAQADWDANKTLTMPDPSGRAVIGSGTGSGLTARTHGDVGGEEEHLLTVAEMPQHQHSGGQATFQTTAVSGSGSGWSGGPINTDFTGGSTAHNNMQPWLALNWIVKY